MLDLIKRPIHNLVLEGDLAGTAGMAQRIMVGAEVDTKVYDQGMGKVDSS